VTLPALILDEVNGSSANRELVQRMLQAYLAQDEEALRAIINPEGEIYGDPGIVNAGTYRGYDGFRQWVQQWEDAWDEISYELGELIDIGDTVVVAPVHVVGRGAGSGVEIDSVFGWMYEFRDGRAVRFHVYPTLDSALETARRLADE
jgi:ketosteroid isomerase-like protein